MTNYYVRSTAGAVERGNYLVTTFLRRNRYKVKYYMQNFGVIGYPLTHSLSPQIHNFAFQKLGIDAIYKKIEISPEIFKKEILNLKNSDVDGLNVTIPHKLSIISFLDEIDPDARVIGAVNTVVRKGNRWIGYNTDVSGFLSPLQRYKNEVTNCLILGTGGAARAVLFALAEYLNPDSITVVGRPEDKPSVLSTEFGTLFKNIMFYHHSLTKLEPDLSAFNLIVNATPLGTFPVIDQTPLPQLKKLSDKTIVYDLVYNPYKTTFLNDAIKAGKNIIVINGIKMLIQQAASAFKLWTNQEMPVNDVRKHILNLESFGQ